MPAFITHTLFGEELLGTLPPWLKTLVEKNRESYTWGLQGPDILFYRRVKQGGSPLNKIGNRMHHEETDRLFSAMADYCASRREKGDREAVLAYLVGFIGHHAADSTCHPYVYWLQEQMSRAFSPHWAGMAHHSIESDMDSTLYRLRYLRSVHGFDVTARFSKEDRVLAPIALLYASVLHTVYGLTVPPGEISMALREARGTYRVLVDPTGGILTGAVQVAEAFVGQMGAASSFLRRDTYYDVLNLDHRPWYRLDTPAIQNRESVPDLLKLAGERARGMIEEAARGAWVGSGYHPTGLRPFDDGKDEPLTPQ